jgi:hypothetical protein
VLGKIQQICSPTFCVKAGGSIQRQANVLSDFRTISPVDRIFVIPSRPFSGKIRLSKRSRAAQEKH